jgi:PilZ domain
MGHVCGNSSLLMAEVHAVDEHRTAPRRRLLKSGKISFGGSAIDCTVRNFSDTGAALDVTSPVGIPDHFTLLIESDHFHVPCQVVWRKQSRIGVRFDKN